jgi:hypothetical protein
MRYGVTLKYWVCVLSRRCNLLLSSCSSSSRPCFVGEVILLDPLSRSIRSIECRIVTNIIIRTDQRLQDGSIKPN